VSEISEAIGIEKGKEIGLQAGQLKEKYEMLIKFHAEGFELPIMSRLTGLSLEQIQAFFTAQGLG
jgi:hypothetical protein